MICTGNRVHVQTENGESDILVLMAIAKAAFELAPRGLDADSEFGSEDGLDPEEIAELIEVTPRGYELVMLEVRGRSCMTHVAPTLGIKGALEVNRDIYEGSVLDLLDRAQAIIPTVIGMNNSPTFVAH
jgi:hypothetical protein